MDKYIQIFIDFIPNDKSFIDMLMPKYESEFRTIGRLIEEHSTSLNCKDNEFMEELLDFLDGNGFEVIHPQVRSPYNHYPIQLIPIYERTITQGIETTTQEIETITKEIVDENERLKAALEKIQSALSEYVPVQTCSLSYTSVEDSEGPILECEEFYTPWPIRLRIHRCMELLRLVSTGWSRSAPLPRPP